MINSEAIREWSGVAIRIIATIIILINIKRIWKAIIHAFGPDGLDKKELGGIVMLIVGIYMVKLEGHRTDLQHQLYSDMLYFIVFGAAMAGLGINSVMKQITKIYAAKNGTVNKNELDNGESDITK